MRHRVDPDALHSWLLGWWGQEVAAKACPEVAEPYDYHADWTADLGPSGDKYLRWNCNYCGLSRYREPTARHSCPERPAEPVSERCQWYGHDGEGPQCDRAATTWRKSPMYPDGRPLCAEHRAIMDREYPDRPAEPSPAPAADPGLTDEELSKVWFKAKEDNRWRPEPIVFHECLRAVADAQLAKAGKPVTISRAEISQAVRSSYPFEEIVKLLCRHRIEVTK